MHPPKLQELVQQTKTLIEETICFHLYLFSRLYEAMLKQTNRFPYLSSAVEHLTSYLAVPTTKENLFEQTRKRYPSFEPPELLWEMRLVSEERDTSDYSPSSRLSEVTPSILKLEAGATPVTLQELALNPELESYRNFAGSFLTIQHYQADRAIGETLDSAFAVSLVKKIEDFAEDWQSDPTAKEVDAAKFWQRDVWGSTIQLDSFLWTLYRDPMARPLPSCITSALTPHFLRLIFDTEQPEEHYRVFAVSTEENSWFYNEGGDVLWIAAHRTEGMVIAMYASFTD